MIFGKLTVLNRAGVKNGYRCWECLCSCGKKVIVRSGSLRCGDTKSCGCFQRERARAVKTTHGLYGGHGSPTRIYRIWLGIRRRCNNSNYRDYRYYGGKGIGVAKAWDDFSLFHEWATNNGYTDNLTIDRINPKGNYTPQNCHWITRSENTARANRGRRCITDAGRKI